MLVVAEGSHQKALTVPLPQNAMGNWNQFTLVNIKRSSAKHNMWNNLLNLAVKAKQYHKSLMSDRIFLCG